MPDDVPALDALELTAKLTAAWLSNPNTRSSVEDAKAFLIAMHASITSISEQTAEALVSTLSTPPVEYPLAVSIRRSLASKEHIISLIDGKPYRALRRHLKSHSLTPDEYRSRYGLKADYPMVAEAYSESRRAMAKKIGLGRKPGTSVAASADVLPPAARPRGRPKSNT